MANMPINPIAVQGGMGSVQAALPQGNANTGQPSHVSRKKSDTRFRSFAERWVVARAHLITADPQKMAEDTYCHILDAKRAYAMIRSVGENIEIEIE